MTKLSTIQKATIYATGRDTPGQYPNYPVPGPSDPGYANASMERAGDNLFTQSPPDGRKAPKPWLRVAAVMIILAVCIIMPFM